MRKVPVELQSWKEFFQSRVEITSVYSIQIVDKYTEVFM